MRLLCLYCLLTLLSLLPAVSITVSGTVLGTDGKPFAGAQVVGIAYRQEVPTTSDNTGTFSVTLDNVDEDAAANVPVGRVTVYAPGFAVTGGMLHRQGNIYRLAPSGKVSGVVTDNQGHALAGVRMSLSNVQWMQGKTSSFCTIPSQLSHRFTVATDADGRWVIADVVPQGKAWVTVCDPRYITQGQDVPLGPDAAPAPALVARPAALCSGCVKFVDGKPASAVHVTARIWVKDDTGEYRATDEADTGADGTYALGGLPGGSATLEFVERSGQWVAPQIDQVVLIAGETVTAPLATLTTGALIDGKVSDADTGKPIVHAWMSISGPQGDVECHTDNTGAYHLRVAPGNISVMLFLPKDFLQDQTKYALEVQAGEHKRQDFTAKKGLTLSGTLVDEEGHPLHQVLRLFLSNLPNSDTPDRGYTDSDAQGHFTFKGLTAGKKSAALHDSNYEYMELGTLEVPSKGPVTLMVKLTPKNATLTHTITARVLTTEGKPLPGVQVKVMVDSDQSCWPVEAASNLHGVLAYEKVPQNGTLMVITAHKPGYRFMAGGKSHLVAGEAALTDIIMAPCTSSVQGTVIDVAGKPVAGAKVMEARGDYTSVTTDAHGQFQLSALPSGAVTLFAATDRAFGTATIHTGAAPVTLVLATTAAQAEQDLPRARTLLQRLFVEAKGGQYRARFFIPCELAPYDVPAMMKMFTDDGGTLDTFQLIYNLSPHIAGVPAATLDELTQRIDHIDSQAMQIASCAMLGYALCERDPTRARQLYAEAKEYRGDTTAKADEKDEEKAYSVMFDIFLAPLAARLKNGEEQDYLDRIMEALKTPKVGEKIWEALSGGIPPGMVKISPVLAQRIIKAIPTAAPNRLLIMARIIPAVTVFDEKSAAQWLTDAASDEKLAAQWLLETGEQDPYSQQYFTQLTASVFAQLGKADAAGVAALARAVHDPQGRMVALAMAADSQPPTEALSLLKEAVDLASNDTQSQLLLCRICAKMYRLKPDAGRKLFALLRERMNSDQAMTDSMASLSRGRRDDPDMSATLAFYGRMIDPSACRLLLEASLQLPQREMPGYSSSTLPLILAMAPLDFPRAEALARALPAQDGMRYEAQRKLAQYLLTPAADRPNIAFDRWCNNYHLRSGIPLGW